MFNSNGCTLNKGGNACCEGINNTAKAYCAPNNEDAIAGHLGDNELLGRAADPSASENVCLNSLDGCINIGACLELDGEAVEVVGVHKVEHSFAQ